MYPTLSDLLKDLLNVNLPLPIQTFGFFVALSFLAAAQTLSMELKRKQSQGLLRSTTRRVQIGKPASVSELLLSGILGFLVGFKLVYFTMHYGELVDDPQAALLSLRGSMPGGLLMGLLFAGMQYRNKNKLKKERPEWIEENVSPSDQVSNLTMVAAVAGILGAKIFHNLENLDKFLEHPLDELISFSGLTMYGGLIVGAIAVLVYGRKHGIPSLHLSDAAAPGLMLAYGVGRIGCQLSGDGDWGIPNPATKPSSLSFLPDWAWSFTYPHNVINAGERIPGCDGKHCSELLQGVYPTPLYESLACILLFFVLWSLRKRIVAPGMMFSLYLLLNGIERFCIEQIRVNPDYHVAGVAFTQAQLISVLLILLGTTGLIYFRRKFQLHGNTA